MPLHCLTDSIISIKCTTSLINSFWRSLFFSRSSSVSSCSPSIGSSASPPSFCSAVSPSYSSSLSSSGGGGGGSLWKYSLYRSLIAFPNPVLSTVYSNTSNIVSNSPALRCFNLISISNLSSYIAIVSSHTALRWISS